MGQLDATLVPAGGKIKESASVRIKVSSTKSCVTEHDQLKLAQRRCSKRNILAAGEEEPTFTRRN